MAPVVGRIRRRSCFRALARPDGRGSRGPLSVAFKVAPVAEDGPPLVGYAIGRRTGTAVIRNRLRRRLREAVRQSAEGLPAGAYLIRTEPPAAELQFGALRDALQGAAAQAVARARRKSGK